MCRSDQLENIPFSLLNILTSGGTPGAAARYPSPVSTATRCARSASLNFSPNQRVWDQAREGRRVWRRLERRVSPVMGSIQLITESLAGRSPGFLLYAWARAWRGVRCASPIMLLYSLKM